MRRVSGWVSGLVLGLALGLSPAGCGGGGGMSPAGSDAGPAAAPPPPDAAASGDAQTAAAADARVDGASVDVADAASAIDTATWSSIYADLLANPAYPSNCAGALCHDPGKEKRIDLSSAATGYASLRPRVVPGSPSGSELVLILQSGAMPQGRPRMPADAMARIRAWIQAGAQQN